MSDDYDPLDKEIDIKRMLREGERGKYAERMREGTNVVLLDPDVSKAFPNSETVNEALRLVLKIMEISRKPSASE